MAKVKMEKTVTPKGELQYVFITGEGREQLDKTKPKRYQATLRIKSDSPELEAYREKVLQYWKDHKPDRCDDDEYKSIGIKPEMVWPVGKDGKPDKSKGKKSQKHTGYHLIDFWTNTKFKNKDGSESPKVVNIYNAKGTAVDLKGKKIGNESEGYLTGVMGLYDTGIDAGVNLLLNGIQITKFVEYKASDLVVEEEDGWSGEDEFEGLEETSENDNPPLEI